MSVRGNRRTLLGMIKLVGLAYIPLIGVYYGVVKMVVGRQGWTHGLFVLSICGNILFALVLLLGYLESKKAEQPDVPESGALVAPECLQCSQGPLQFCEAASHSELRRLEPNAVFVASDGLFRARFGFTDDNLEVLEEVTIFDKYGRPWIHADLEDGTLIYNRYTDVGQVEYSVSLMDKDADGIPDKMVNWELGVAFKVEQEITWRPIDRE